MAQEKRDCFEATLRKGILPGNAAHMNRYTAQEHIRTNLGWHGDAGQSQPCKVIRASSVLLHVPSTHAVHPPALHTCEDSGGRASRAAPCAIPYAAREGPPIFPVCPAPDGTGKHWRASHGWGPPSVPGDLDVAHVQQLLLRVGPAALRGPELRQDAAQGLAQHRVQHAQSAPAPPARGAKGKPSKARA